jgi:hypothetical protein
MVAANQRINALDCFGTRAPSKKDPYAAMKAAGALFGLKKVSLADWSGRPANDDLHVIVRTDTDAVIGQVGNNYKCFPNEEFFGPVAQSLVESGAQITRFQMIDGGTRAFMRLAWPEDQNLRIGPPKVGDIVGRRAILSTSHDGKHAGKFILQMLRLACDNGMTIPVGAYDTTLTHTVGGEQQLIDLQKLIPVIETYVRRFQVAADLLAATKVEDDTADEIITRIADPRETGKNRAAERVGKIIELFNGKQPDADNRAIKGTGWGLYNAAVDFFTHDKGTRGENKDEQRFKSLLPGGPANREIVRAWGIVIDGLGVKKALDASLAATN